MKDNFVKESRNKQLSGTRLCLYVISFSQRSKIEVSYFNLPTQLLLWIWSLKLTPKPPFSLQVLSVWLLDPWPNNVITSVANSCLNPIACCCDPIIFLFSLNQSSLELTDLISCGAYIIYIIIISIVSFQLKQHNNS